MITRLLLFQYTSTYFHVQVFNDVSGSKHCDDDVIDRRQTRIPNTKATLRKCLSRRRCREFRAGQNLHNYYFEEWLHDNWTQWITPVTCFVKDKQEP